MSEHKITLCRLTEFATCSGLFEGVKPPCYRTLLKWKKQGILATDPLTNMIDVAESTRRFLFRQQNGNRQSRRRK